MRVDQAHSDRIEQASSTLPDGSHCINLDIQFMHQAMDRLSLWEQGLLTKVLLHAAKSKRKTHAQRVLLALFISNGGDDK